MWMGGSALARMVSVGKLVVHDGTVGSKQPDGQRMGREQFAGTFLASMRQRRLAAWYSINA